MYINIIPPDDDPKYILQNKCRSCIYRIRETEMMSRHNRIVMKMSIYIVFSVFFLIQSVAASADDKSAAEKTLKSRLNAAIAVLQNKDGDLQVKKNEIDAIMMPIFDFSLMAKLSLGKKYWPQLPSEHKEKFTELFTKMMKRSYREKLTRYTDEKIIYDSPIQIKKKIRIQTYLISKDEKTSILYKLYKHRNEWKVYDIAIEGVSIIRSYRSQFYHILKTETVDDLLVKLEKSVNG